ncbi:MAG: LysM peptidoglycan-binding domain-containing protein, partial [Kiritimatiellia bacterium]
AAAPAPQIHVVPAGDNLATISPRYYGTPAKWKLIFNANQDRLSDANNPRVGTRIDIPPS